MTRDGRDDRRPQLRRHVVTHPCDR
jgi:hypothetical protein